MKLFFSFSLSNAHSNEEYQLPQLWKPININTYRYQLRRNFYARICTYMNKMMKIRMRFSYWFGIVKAILKKKKMFTNNGGIVNEPFSGIIRLLWCWETRDSWRKVYKIDFKIFLLFLWKHCSFFNFIKWNN